MQYSRAEILKRYQISGFNSSIHKNDLMFQHHFKKMTNEPAVALFHYYNVGLAALNKLSEELGELDQISSVLDFGSGYGRGSRFLPAFFPNAKISVSEIKPGALAFQASQFGYNTIHHSEDPKSFMGDNFDLIIAVSVFSHLPEEATMNWLRALTDCLSKGGSLLFTYNPRGAGITGDYEFIAQSEDLGMEWVSDRIKQSNQYGSAFYSEQRMAEIMNKLSLSYKLLPGFSGSQNAVLIKK